MNLLKLGTVIKYGMLTLEVILIEKDGVTFLKKDNTKCKFTLRETEELVKEI